MWDQALARLTRGQAELRNKDENQRGFVLVGRGVKTAVFMLGEIKPYSEIHISRIAFKFCEKNYLTMHNKILKKKKNTRSLLNQKKNACSLVGQAVVEP